MKNLFWSSKELAAFNRHIAEQDQRIRDKKEQCIQFEQNNDGFQIK